MVVVLVALFAACMNANAGSYFECQTKTQQAETNCHNKLRSANEQKTTLTTPAAAQAPMLSGNAFSLGSVASQSSALDGEVIAYCQPLIQSQCVEPCASVEKENQPNANIAAQKCKEAIQTDVATAQTSQSNLANDANKSNGTGNSASGMPTSPSPSPTPSPSATSTPSPSPTPATSSATAATATTATSNPTGRVATAGFGKCNGDQAYLVDGCASQLISQCNQHYRQSGLCESFSARYCSTAGDSGQASSGAVKAGEGVGSSFCTGYLAASSSFTCTSATASCPSCSHVTPSAGASIPDACKNDPAFANPAVAQAAAATGSSAAGGGGGGASGGGGGSSAGAMAAAAAALGQAKLPGEVKALNEKSSGHDPFNLAVDGGGGGGGGGSGSSFSLPDYSLSANSPAAKRKLASNTGQTELQSTTTDVEHLKGPNVFMISTQVLLQRCQRGKLMHCGGSHAK